MQFFASRREQQIKCIFLLTESSKHVLQHMLLQLLLLLLLVECLK